MRSKFTLAVFSFFILFFANCKTENENSIKVQGLQAQVEIIRDSVGINHIYALNQHDLFFAQGYCAAKDRLFQFEVWRRQATGTVAEILGEDELKRDIGARLFKYRGDLTKELNHYHPQGQAIINAYVDGVNAYIDEVLQHPDSLPMEFKILNILPGKWTPEVVISRHQGLLGNITYELDFGRAVAKVGADVVKEIMWFHPKDPEIRLDPMLNSKILEQDILELYNAFREPVNFNNDDVGNEYQSDNTSHALSTKKIDPTSIGSNNWVVNGTLSESGSPLLANDPHRRIAIPSLRYMVHLVSPNWNVIGGGEPEIPGISIGHNPYGAWGLTVFETDGEDLYVYELNPDNYNQYRYENEWVELDSVNETIPIKGKEAAHVTLYYTQHGPVTFIDSVNHLAFAARCAWLEPGGAPYLASLRMNQSKNWEEFRDACSYSHIPGENMIWADINGNIGWQAVGIAPVRKNFSGLIPVPGNGQFEWDGYLPILDKPNAYNPQQNFIETANENVTPENYSHWDAIGFEWADPYRGQRISEVLSSKEKLTIADMEKLQTDYLSIPARTLVPYLKSLKPKTELEKEAIQKLLNWNFELNPQSIEAGIYVAWENEIKSEALKRFVPESIKDYIYLQMFRIIEWISKPDKKFGLNPVQGRNDFLTQCFSNAVQNLKSKFGEDMSSWKYGQENYKHSYIQHALSNVVHDSLKKTLNVGPAIRGGNSYTVGATGSELNQKYGASFRMVMDLSDWDKAVGTNPPGQSGNPASPLYNNLFESWASDKYFPVFYTKEKILSIASAHYYLKP